MLAKPVICPRCGRTDAVRKVTSVLAAETVTTDRRGFGSTNDECGLKFVDVYASSTSHSGLAAKLRPPIEPHKPSGNPTLFLFMRIGFALMGLAFLAATFACASMVLLFTSTVGRVLIVAELAVFVIVVVLAVRWVISGSWRVRRKIREEREQYSTSYKCWQRAYERWQQLYYCARDDGIFLPGETRFVAVEQMKELLFSSKRKNAPGLKVKLVSPKSHS